MPALSAIRKQWNVWFARVWRWEFWRRLPLRLSIRYVDAERACRRPTKLQIEPTSHCNLRCPSCPHARDTSPPTHLTADDLRGILDRLPFRPAEVILSGIGEPLMSPHFFALVDVLAQRRIRCQFFTNGTLLTPKNCAAILARANLVNVQISCDGARKETFEALRAGADFDRWKDAVRQFIAAARQQRGRRLTVGANVVVGRQNLAEVREIIDLTAELGFGSVNVMEPVPVDAAAEADCPPRDALSAACQQDLVALGKQRRLAVACGFHRDAVPPRAMVRCIQPWYFMLVRVSGEVAPCCAIFGAERAVSMGNLRELGFGDIWRGEQFREFRRSSAAGTNALCRSCPFY